MANGDITKLEEYDRIEVHATWDIQVYGDVSVLTLLFYFI